LKSRQEHEDKMEPGKADDTSACTGSRSSSTGSVLLFSLLYASNIAQGVIRYVCYQFGLTRQKRNRRRRSLATVLPLALWPARREWLPHHIQDQRHLLQVGAFFGCVHLRHYRSSCANPLSSASSRSYSPSAPHSPPPPLAPSRLRSCRGAVPRRCSGLRSWCGDDWLFY
jgi:hypothetical protein